MRKRVDLTGQRYGALTVVEYAGSDRHGALWLCRCDCGNNKTVHPLDLERGKVMSCGCRRSPDLTGHVFGRLTVVRRAGSRRGKSIWLCRCGCGNEAIVSAVSLNRGVTRSCGCLVREGLNLAGHVFGRLTAIECVGNNGKAGKHRWLCQCECGNEVLVPSDRLRSGETRSCGCLKADTSAATGRQNVIHGGYANGSKPDYPAGWTEEFRELVRARDGHTCQICGAPQNGRAHDVHHIDYDPENTVAENCIALCSKCHGHTNGDRDYWRQVLQAGLPALA